MEKLQTVRINQHSKPINFEGIDQFENLQKLVVGDFSPIQPVPIPSLEFVSNCKNLKILFFGNVKIESAEIRQITKLKELQQLRLPQNIEVEDLAFLSAKMPKVISNELKAWQQSPREPDILKINGRKRPYLNKIKDQLKIVKFENDFEQLRNGFL